MYSAEWTQNIYFSICCCCKVASVVSDPVWPHRWQPTSLSCPWDSPGKKTEAGCHFLLQYMKVKSESEVAQSCPTLSNPMDCSLPGSTVHEIFQARVLEWGAIAFSTHPSTAPNLTQILSLEFICHSSQPLLYFHSLSSMVPKPPSLGYSWPTQPSPLSHPKEGMLFQQLCLFKGIISWFGCRAIEGLLQM